MPHGVSACLASKQEAQSFDQYRFAGTSFTGYDIKTWRKVDR
jgi:hypothetical protein